MSIGFVVGDAGLFGFTEAGPGQTPNKNLTRPRQREKRGKKDEEEL